MARPDDNQRIELNELGNAKRWDRLIEMARKEKGSPLYTEYEQTFIADMIRRNDDDRPIWSPTRKQYNMLHTLMTG